MIGRYLEALQNLCRHDIDTHRHSMGSDRRPVDRQAIAGSLLDYVLCDCVSQCFAEKRYA